MTQDKRITDFYDYLGYLFGFDRIEINRINDSTLEMRAIISSEETVLNYYKLFLAYINEIEMAKNDPEALLAFKEHLIKCKEAFDNRIESACNEIKTKFEKFKVEMTLSYEGEVKKVYGKVSELVT